MMLSFALLSLVVSIFLGIITLPRRGAALRESMK
jgi:hypothetical protein